MSEREAKLCQIFNSIQGEGLYVGERQTFIRFAGCNLSCQYCDTPQALSVPKTFKVEPHPGKKEFKTYKNPATLSQLVEFVKSFEKAKELNHSICLTGGEPLLQVDFLEDFISVLKKEVMLPIYLETNGVLPKHLSEIIDQVDIIAFDIKLPSATGLSPYWNEHRKALEIAFMRNVFVKIVFSRESKTKELMEAVDLIASISEKIPLVLQPVTPFGRIKHRPQPDQMIAFQSVAKRKLKEVRVIPQAHKILGFS